MKRYLVVVAGIGGVVALVGAHLLALHVSGSLLHGSPAVAIPVVALAVVKHVGVFTLLRRRLRPRP